MEAVPRLPMICFDLKISPDSFSPQFSKLKQYIRDFYNEDPESYSTEVRNLETLRANAVHPAKDATGCAVLKKYYCQLHFLQSRFPIGREDVLSISFVWKDAYSGVMTTNSDIKFEMVNILYNIGALHTLLGAADDRSTPEGLKMACTHFQCAAWAFQHLKDSYPQQIGVDTCISSDLMQFMYQLCLAQAQECILEKSMTDNRKATINAKVAAQIVDYYNLAVNALLQEYDGSIYDIVGSKLAKSWKKYIKFKISYYGCISLLYQGMQSEEQQKMGERIAYYQGALDKLNDAIKLSKGVEHGEIVNEALVFTRDVVEGKRKAAKNENDFIYHEDIPELDSLPIIKGASLVKGIPFNVNDPEISGTDIFSRLVPMKAHEVSSLYSEEKAKLLRRINSMIDSKDEEVVSFMSSLQLDYLRAHLDAGPVLPQEVVDRCAALSAKPDAIPNLVAAMDKLSDAYHDVDSMLKEVMERIKVEESAEEEYQEVMGRRPPSIVATDLTREAAKYGEAHRKAAESNETLHRAMTQHIENLRVLQQPLEEIAKNLPDLNSLNLHDDPTVKEVMMLVDKVTEMRRQRAMLASQLRESICSDDITTQLVTRTDENQEEIFEKEMQKHNKYVSLIEQNLAAQDNIIPALTDAYARYASTRKSVYEIMRQRETMLSALISSYDAYEDLITKTNKGLEFYRKLETNLTKLLQRVKGTCKVQQEERDSILAQNNKKIQKSIDSSPSNTPGAPTSGGGGGGGLKLKDYLQNRKLATDSTSVPYFPGQVPENPQQPYVPAIRPAPLGSEGTSTPKSMDFATNYSGYDQYGTDYAKNYLYNYQNPLSVDIHNLQYPSMPSASNPYQVSPGYAPKSTGYDNFDPQNVGSNATSNMEYQYSYGQNPGQGYQGAQAYMSPGGQNTSYSGTSQLASQPGPSSGQSYGQSSGQSFSTSGGRPSTVNQTSSGQSGLQQYPGQQSSAGPGIQGPFTQNPSSQSGAQNFAGQQSYASPPVQSYSSSVAGTSSVIPGIQGHITQNTSSQSGAQNFAGQQSYASPPVQSYSSSVADSSSANPGIQGHIPQNTSSQSGAQNFAGQQSYGSPAIPSYSSPVAGTSSVNPGIQGHNTSSQSVAQNFTGQQQSYVNPAVQSFSPSIPTPSETQSTQNFQSSAIPSYPNSTQVSYDTQISNASSNVTQSYSANSTGNYVDGTNSLYQNYQTPASQDVGSYSVGTAYAQGSNPSTYSTNAGSYSYPSTSQWSSEQYTGVTPISAPGGNVPYSNNITPVSTGQNIYTTNISESKSNPYQAGTSSEYAKYYADYSNVYPNVQFQGTPGTTGTSFYSNAGGKSTVETNSSGVTPEGLTYASQYVAATVAPDVAYYYNSPYGYQYVSPTTPLPSNKNDINTQAVDQQNQLTYIQSSNNTTTMTFSQQQNGGGASTTKSQKEPSNVDLLTGLDFNISDTPPLQPLKPENKMSIELPQEKLANLSLESKSASSTKPSTSNVASDINKQNTTATPPHNGSQAKLTPAENPAVARSSPSKTPQKDPFSDPEILSQFAGEVDKFEKFVEGLNSKTLNGPTPLDLKWNELQDLQEKDAHKQIISVARCYPMKNRFPDILPYDNSRVELPSTKDDYINASHVKDLRPYAPNFILTQAPLPSTFADFWTMVMEQHVEIIVCLLSDSQMNGEIYWPMNKTEDLLFGKIKVSLQSMNSKQHWIERIISVSDGKVSRVVVHLQFTSWPTSWMPESPGPLLSLVSETLGLWSQQRSRGGPLVVHCDSGTGRSGVFVLLCLSASDLSLTSHLPEHILLLTGELARWRKAVLRDRSHLEFLYRCLLYYCQDMLMKRGILASRSTFDEKRPKNKSHTRHPSQDFLLNNSLTSEQNEERRQSDTGSTGSSKPSQENDPLSSIDPLWQIKKSS